jgi:CBS domain-containing protein
VLSDKIAALKLPAPLCVAGGTSVGQVIDTVQQHRAGAVLICEGKRITGIITERDVLMKIVARDVSFDEPVEKFMTPDPQTLTPDRTIGEAITLMNSEGFRNIPIVDAKTGEAIALFRVRDVIDHLAESFPEHVINLPPRPHQKMQTPEGA